MIRISVSGTDVMFEFNKEADALTFIETALECGFIRNPFGDSNIELTITEVEDD